MLFEALTNSTKSALDKEQAAYLVKRRTELRDYLHQGMFAPVGDYFGPIVVSYMLVGLDAEHYKPDLNTDTVAMYLKARQAPNGEWAFPRADTRPPLCSDYIGQTALSMRALQLYAPKVDKAGYDQAIRLAAAWIAKAQPQGNDDRAWQVLGLAWAGTDKAALSSPASRAIRLC